MSFFKLRHSLRGHSIVGFQHQFSFAGGGEIWVAGGAGTYWQDWEETWSRGVTGDDIDTEACGTYAVEARVAARRQ